MRLISNIVIGKRVFSPKLEWERVAQDLVVKMEDYSYIIKKVLPRSKKEVVTWVLAIHSHRKNRRMGEAGKKELAMAYTRLKVMAIAELLEMKEAEAKSFCRGKPNRIFTGAEYDFIDSSDWEIEGKNHAYYHCAADAYELSRPDGCKESDPWELRIVYPGGADASENMNAWELRNIDSLEIGQAIATLMNL